MLCDNVLCGDVCACFLVVDSSLEDTERLVLARPKVHNINPCHPPLFILVLLIVMVLLSKHACRWQLLVAAILFLFCTCNSYHITPSFSRHCSSLRLRDIHKYLQTSIHHASATEIEEATPLSSLQISSASSQLDPLLTSFLLRSIQSNSLITFSDVSKATIGLSIWEKALRKARLPTIDDFQSDESITWPEEPLFTYVYDTFSSLGLPRLVRRHHEALTTSVLLSVAKVVVEFIKAQRQGKLVILDSCIEDEENDDDGYDWENEIDAQETEYEYEPLSIEELNQLADSLTNNLLKQEWDGVVGGLAQLDKVFGYDHGLLDQQGGYGFGVNDGVWDHTGWSPMPELQRRISAMPELRDLLLKLGRRPSAEGKDTRRFRPRKRSYAQDDMMGVELDPLFPSTLSGLTYGSSLTTMLPTEAVLLRSSMRALRLLFLAKKAESKLLSYELSGYTDVPTKPLPNARRSIYMPSDSGGPLIICLDTSHSMSGVREDLSKAVVLASVTTAHRQGRDCRVVAYSSNSNTIESGTITCDAAGIRRLLDFLSYSFGGGSDVSGALKYAMEVLESDMSSSDVLLVSDGEIPNPPVSKVVMAKLEGLKQSTGMEIHGLLVGKKESESMNLLCNEVHDFLSGYEGINGVSASPARRVPISSSALSLSPSSSRVHHSLGNRQSSLRRRVGLSLYATSNFNDETDDFNSLNVKLNKRGEKSKSKRRRYDNEEDDDDDYWSLASEEIVYRGKEKPSNIIAEEDQEEKSEFILRVEDAISALEDTATKLIEDRQQSSGTNISPSSPSMSKVISDTINYVESGLVERDLEARLVVLGMVSQEHILFIGPPGTSKSEIGRRLSQLCGGPFFQRLFTKFTTPDEICGPLSLRALENDEYQRVIDGFLPTATVAFLDEIFKANSAILNTLLTILNERKFDNGAGNRVDCPLKCVIGASNELPDSEELDALLDRFLLKSYVTSVSDDGLVQILTLDSSASNEVAIDSTISDSLDNVVAEISSALDGVEIGLNISLLIRDLRSFLRDEIGIYVSDRRLVKAARLLKVAAASNGRDRVDYIDCLLLQHVLWQLPEQRDVIREWLWDNMTPSGGVVEQTTFIFQGLASESLELMKKTMGDVTGASGARAADLDAVNSVRAELEKIQELLIQNSHELERHIQLLDADHLWISQDEAQASKQHLVPLAEEESSAVNQTLLDTVLLKLALTSDDIANELRSSVVESLDNQDNSNDTTFTNEELELSLKEAKKEFKGDMLRQWKATRKQRS